MGTISNLQEQLGEGTMLYKGGPGSGRHAEGGDNRASARAATHAADRASKQAKKEDTGEAHARAAVAHTAAAKEHHAVGNTRMADSHASQANAHDAQARELGVTPSYGRSGQHQSVKESDDFAAGRR